MKTDGHRDISCSSILAQQITEYVELKRACGYKFDQETYYLNKFDMLCAQENLDSISIPDEILKKWEQKTEGENETTHQHRVRIVRAFSSFLHNNDFDAPCTFHPLPKRNRDFVPYIFSMDEIRVFFRSLYNLTAGYIAISPIRPYVVPVLFKTLYCCGLRLSEATHIKKECVDYNDRTIKILNSKGDKDRIVVMSQSLKDNLKSYSLRPEVRDFESEYLFPSPDHQAYVNYAIYETFRKALLLAGIPHRGRGKGPRVHDLRHSFAVHVLSKWQKEGKDLYVCLPVLSAYLGHENLKMTETYLRLVPETYAELTNAFENAHKTLFPEVQDEAE